MADDDKNRFMEPDEAYRAASDLIDYAIKGRWDELMLTNMGLERVPEKIGECDRLTSLDLSGNRLTHLADGLRALTDLQALSLRSNQLEALPEWIYEFEILRQINLAENRLSGLPVNFAGLKRLVDLDLSVNRFADLPPAIRHLKKLRILNLANNNLIAIVVNSREFAALESLDLSYNDIAEPPDTIGFLDRLEALMLGGNQLADLPVSLREMERLNVLHLHSNKFLDLPRVLGFMHGLDYLTLKHNPLHEPLQSLVSNFDSREMAEDGKETARRVRAYFGTPPPMEAADLAHAEDLALTPYAAPEQGPAPHIYEPDDEGRIAPVRRSGIASQPDIAATLYEAVKRKAGALSERVRGRNTPRLEVTSTALLKAMGASIAEIDQGVFWEKTISIRADADAYGSPANEGELMPEVLAELLDLTASAEALLTAFPSIQAVIREAEAERIPEEVVEATDQALSALTDEVAAHPEVVTPEAVETLRENDEAIADARDAQEKRLLLAAKSLNLRNLIAALLKRGADLRDHIWAKIRKGAPQTAGIPGASTLGTITTVVTVLPAIARHVPNWEGMTKSGQTFSALVDEMPIPNKTAASKPAPKAQAE